MRDKHLINGGITHNNGFSAVGGAGFSWCVWQDQISCGVQQRKIIAQMDQTHSTRGVNGVLVLSVLSFGLLTGAMLLIGISIVGFWKSLTPSEFSSWFAAHSSRLGAIMIPLGVITVLVSLAAAAVSWRSHAKQRRWAVIAAICALCVMVSYPVFFAGANASFIAGGLSDSAVRALLDKWALWHWGRTLLGLAGFLAATLALQSSGR